MLMTKTAFFHIQFILFQLYDNNKNIEKVMQKLFLVVNKFIQKNIIYNYAKFNNSNTSLCLFNQNNNDFYKARLIIIELGNLINPKINV
jgi:hypothetical protein